MAEPFYITTAISYPNGKPHIGHAYEAIAADAIARFQRQAGRDVRFQTGTDEHGLKMVQTARDQGVAVADLAAEMSSLFRGMCDDLNISYDRFIRTTDPDHYAASQAIWKAMEAAGDLYLDRYEGWYSVRDEAFYDEKELVDGEGGQKLSPQGHGSFAFRSTSSRCLICMPQSRTSFARNRGETRSCASWKGGFRTCPCLAPASTGGCRFRVAPGT